MAGIHVGSILSWLTTYKANDSFIWVGFVYTDWVRVPVGGAEGWGACCGGDEFLDACFSGSFIVAIKIACVCLLNKLRVD